MLDPDNETKLMMISNDLRVILEAVIVIRPDFLMTCYEMPKTGEDVL